MAEAGGAGGKVSSVMQESRVFPPPTEFAKRARIGSLEDYRGSTTSAARDPEGFWHARARLCPG